MMWEVWAEPDDDEFTMADPEGIADMRQRFLISPDARCIHRFEAATFDDAMRHYHEWMGWEPYQPM